MLVGRKPTLEEQIRKWKQQIRQQEREIDKSLRSLAMEETKAKRVLKDAAKRKDKVSCNVIAKEIARSRRSKDRMHTAKAQLNSLNITLQHHSAMAKTVGSLQKSTEAMMAVSSLVKIPAIQATMRDMALEMAKSGFISDTIQDTLEDSLPNEEDLEDDMDISDEEELEQINAILYEISEGTLGSKKQVVNLNNAPIVPTNIPIDKEEEQEELADNQEENIKSRLNALREA